jgi:hypothetical protein
MKIAYVALTVLILTLSACSSGREPTATIAATPTAQIIVATPTVEPTATPTVPPTMVAPAESPATPTAEPTARPSPTVAPTSTATPVQPAPAAGPCQNPYYPVVAGASWEYRLSGTGSETFVRSITSVRENGFDDQDVFGAGVTRRGSWECREGNLISLTPGSSASVATSDMQTEVTIESNTGITFPADPRPGTEWTQTMVYRGQQTIGGMNMESRNEMNLSCKAIGMERVSVPAGDFEALRVDCTTQLKISIAGMAAFDMTATGSAWYAPGVGWVKSRDSGDMGTTEIVLLSYSIP